MSPRLCKISESAVFIWHREVIRLRLHGLSLTITVAFVSKITGLGLKNANLKHIPDNWDLGYIGAELHKDASL